MAFHVVGALDECKEIRENGLMNLQEVLKRDTVISKALGYYGIFFDIENRILHCNGEKYDIDYDEVQDQIHAMYKKLKKAKKSKVDIFNEIAQKIHKVSLMDEILCQIVVSYFVQSCEVFDAIT